MYIGAAMEKMGGRNTSCGMRPTASLCRSALKWRVPQVPIALVGGIDSPLCHRSAGARRTAIAPDFLAGCGVVYQESPDLVGDACYGIGNGDRRYVPRSRILPSSSACCNVSGIQKNFSRRMGSEAFRNIIASTRFNSATARWATNLGSRGKAEGRQLQLARAGMVSNVLPLLLHSFVRFDQALGAESSVSTRGSHERAYHPTEMAGETADR